MRFDEIPEDKEESHECEKCGGNIRKKDGFWQCDTCEYHAVVGGGCKLCGGGYCKYD